MFLVFDDKEKEKLDKEGIRYIQIDNIPEIFLEEIIGTSLEISMTYEEIDVNEENINKCYKFLYTNCTEEVQKIAIKLQKFQNESFNLIHGVLKDNKEKILETKIEETDSEQ